jgi:hypothetical protein
VRPFAAREAKSVCAAISGFASGSASLRFTDLHEFWINIIKSPEKFVLIGGIGVISAGFARHLNGYKMRMIRKNE